MKDFKWGLLTALRRDVEWSEKMWVVRKSIMNQLQPRKRDGT